MQSILRSKPQVTFLILRNVVDTIARHISGQFQQIDVITWGELTKQAHCAQTQATEKDKRCGIKIALLHVPDSNKQI